MDSNDKKKEYCNIIEVISRSTDDFLFLMDIKRDENWFFGSIDKTYALRDKGIPTNTTAEMLEVVYPSDRQALIEDLERISSGKQKVHNMNYRWVNRRGEIVWISCRGNVIEDENGEPFLMVGRVSEEALKHLYNPLTGLWNRTKLVEDINRKLIDHTGFLMLMDVRGLAVINLRYGRKFGDDLLKETAVLLEHMPEVNQAYHLQNNNFAVVLEAEDCEAVKRVFLQVQKAMEEKCAFAAGIVPMNNRFFMDADSVLDSAKMTLNKAKEKNGDRIEFFSQDELQQKIKTMALLEEFKESVEHGCEGFELLYQPQVRSSDYCLNSVEALLRYQSKKRGRVFPDEFIPILENSRLIQKVGLWVLEQALLQCREWRRFMPELRVGVNFSLIQFEDEFLVEKICEILNKTGMPGSALVIEITESMELRENEQIKFMLKHLKTNGIRIAMDDFGIGYANVGHLKLLHVDEIKIDRSFIRGIKKDTYNYRLISSVIAFARENALSVCCEGIETSQELFIVEELQSDLIQGYLFDKPCDVQTITQRYMEKETEPYRQREEYIQALIEEIHNKK